MVTGVFDVVLVVVDVGFSCTITGFVLVDVVGLLVLDVVVFSKVSVVVGFTYFVVTPVVASGVESSSSVS
jgi:hypothetical protein